MEINKKQIEALEKIKTYKQACEANVVSMLWKKSDLIYEYNDLKLEDFTFNTWRVFWQICHDIVIVEKKEVLDEITVNLYLEKHSKLKIEYDKDGGYETIQKAGEYVNIENMAGYVSELHKWNSVLKLMKIGYPIEDKISQFADMTIDEIYNFYESNLNHVFINAVSDVKSYDISDGIYDLIDNLDEGLAVGLPYHNLPLLTQETSGMLLGDFNLVLGLSNVGKSTFIRNTLFPSLFEHNERIVVLINEEGIGKWQREILVWVANNIFDYNIQKHMVRDGKYSEEGKAQLIECANWLRDKKEDKIITLIPITSYKTSRAIKIINKYASLGVKYFVIDTLKADAGKVDNNTRLQLTQNSVELYDTIKDSNKNVHLTATFQLSQSSQMKRYYTQGNTGESKTVFNVVATGIMIRKMFEDEYPNKKNELVVYNLDKNNNKVKAEIDPDKNYQIFFIVKNREGAANRYQIVVEHDLSRNTLREVGITHVPLNISD